MMLLVCALGSWCIYEQFKATELGIQVSMILPRQQFDSITHELNKGADGLRAIRTSLTNINAEESEATIKEDGAPLHSIRAH